jgi:hypothetical protein
MKYIIFKTNSKYPEVNDWFSTRLFGKPEGFKKWIACWVRYFQGLNGREVIGGKAYWTFVLKDRGKFIKNLTWRGELVEYEHE